MAGDDPVRGADGIVRVMLPPGRARGDDPAGIEPPVASVERTAPPGPPPEGETVRGMVAARPPPEPPSLPVDPYVVRGAVTPRP
ncbi:hypothetical protein K2Z84_01680, partial [Candidatus Binatia bacterium]|nr:hypothetical protein [Candidatus Binatia bacterium]